MSGPVTERELAQVRFHKGKVAGFEVHVNRLGWRNIWKLLVLGQPLVVVLERAHDGVNVVGLGVRNGTT